VSDEGELEEVENLNASRVTKMIYKIPRGRKGFKVDL
jgi:hypothetical protein